MSVQCDKDWVCPSGSTCCRDGSGSWTCANVGEGGVCCRDGQHACPKKYPFCNSESGQCEVSKDLDPRANFLFAGVPGRLYSAVQATRVPWSALSPAKMAEGYDDGCEARLARTVQTIRNVIDTVGDSVASSAAKIPGQTLGKLAERTTANLRAQAQTVQDKAERWLWIVAILLTVIVVALTVVIVLLLKKR